MKIYLLSIFIVSSLFCFGQRKTTLTSDSVSVTYLIKDDSLSFLEEIQIQNLSQQSIYIPEVNPKEFYFFTLDHTLFSYCGVMASKFGTPNLSLDIKLIKILPKEKFVFFVKVPKKGKDIDNYYFSFEYLKSVDLNIPQNNNLKIGMEKYISLCKYVVSSMEDDNLNYNK